MAAITSPLLRCPSAPEFATILPTHSSPRCVRASANLRVSWLIRCVSWLIHIHARQRRSACVMTWLIHIHTWNCMCNLTHSHSCVNLDVETQIRTGMWMSHVIMTHSYSCVTWLVHIHMWITQSCSCANLHVYITHSYSYMQNIVSFVGLFCKRDL